MSTIHDGPPLYRTNDGRIVAEGDTDAAFLVVGTGGTIPAEFAKDVKAFVASTPDPAPAKAATKRHAGPSEDK